MINDSKTRLEYVDALRGIAILGVIITHAGSIISLEGPLRRITTIGGMGVYLFFVISAFTIFYMLDKHSVKERKPIRNFFIRRLFRIVPVYWAGIVLYTLTFGLESRGWLPGPEIWHYPVHFVLLNLLHPQVQSSVVPGGWSISCEVLFYCTVPIWFYLIRTLSRAYFFLISGVFLFPLITFLSKKISSPYMVGMDPFLTSLYWERFPTSSLGSFCFGIFLFFLLRKSAWGGAFFKSKIVNAVTTFVICVLFLCLPGSYIKFPLVTHIYCFLFMMLAIMLAFHPWKIFVNAFTVFVGRISYSGYLVHFLVLKILTVLIMLWVPFVAQNQYFYFFTLTILGIGLTIPLAYLGYIFIEQPAINLAKRLIEHLEGKPV